MSVINREDAIAKIKDIPYVQEHPNIGLLFEEWLKSLPDADDGWIPVEKRLPEEEQDVLICNEIGDIQLTCGSYSTETDGWIWYTSGWRFGPAIAWRPPPKPYETKEDK